MDLYKRQQFDFLLLTAAERFTERITQRNEGAARALEHLRRDPQGEGIWLDEFVQALFQDFLLDNVAGAAFVLEALHKRKIPPPAVGEAGMVTVETLVIQMAQRAFADLLCSKVEEALEQAMMYG